MFLLAALDTLDVQCVLHCECPDITTTFVAVVPQPVITVAHDTIVCAVATTPSITVDTAGTYQVVVHYKSRGEKEKTVKGSVTVVR